MAPKPALLSMILIFACSAVFAQNPGLQKLRGFDENSYKNLLENHEKFMPYNLHQQPPSSIRIGKSAINNLKVSDDGMAPMPKMSIDKDINYSMKTLKIRIGSPTYQTEKDEKHLDKKELETH